MSSTVITKKRILFVLPGFHIGGTIVSLSNLLSLIDVIRYEIDIFALDASGPYKEKLTNCKILDDNLFFSSRLLGKNLFRLSAFYFLRALRMVMKNVINNTDSFYKFGANKFAKNHYDVVISFQEGDLTEIVYHIPAKKHVAWVLSDYKRYLSLSGNRNELPFYKRYNTVVCVSDYSKRIMQDILPEIRDRVISIHNIIDYTNIRKAAKITENIEPGFDTNIFTIISVGRIDPVKQFEKIPAIAAKIKKCGVPFRWYLIGEKTDETIRQKIFENTKKEKVEAEFIWLENIINVYPYIANANLLVNTSMSESFPLVINEAKVLGIPVIANNFDSAHESVEEGKSGFVLPIENMAEKIIGLITDNSSYATIKDYLSSYKYDNETILRQIYMLLES